MNNEFRFHEEFHRKVRFLTRSKYYWSPQFSMAQKMHYFQGLSPLSANPTKWSNTLKEFVSKVATNCLSVLKGMVMQIEKTLITDRISKVF